MTQSEYCTVWQGYLPDGSPTSGVSIRYLSSGEPGYMPSLDEALASLGQEGWELVSTTPVFPSFVETGMHVAGQSYRFKRQIVSQEADELE